VHCAGLSQFAVKDSTSHQTYFMNTTSISPTLKWILRIFVAVFVVILLILIPATKTSDPVETPFPQHTAATPLITSTSTVTESPENRNREEPYQTVRLAWFYKPPEELMLPVLAEHFDVFILTHKDEDERDTLKSLGVEVPILAYLQLLEIRNPGSCTASPQGNQVAYEIGDFCKISAQHPDWFLLDQNGNRIVDGESVYMDPGNPEYRAFWLQRAKALQEQFHWDGIFIDNLEASLSKIQDKGAIPAKYPDDRSYQSAIEGFLHYLQVNHFKPRGQPVLANIISVRDWSVWLRYLRYLDGAMIEAFAVDWSSDYRSSSDWEDQMAAIDQALSQGKSLILVSQGEQPDSKRQQFALASYLLISNENVAFRYASSDAYREILLFENYYLDLGEPLGPRYKQGSSWRRDFTHGQVLVNPRSHRVEIKLNP